MFESPRIFLVLILTAHFFLMPLEADSTNQNLLSQDSEIRKQAMIDLARSKDISRCQNLLKSEHFLLRKAAVFALARLNSPSDPLAKRKSAQEGLKKALKDSSFLIQFEAARTLAHWGINAGEDILVKALQQPNTLRRRQAAEALYHVGSIKAINHLIYNLRDADESVRSSSIETLRKITGQNFGYNPTNPRDLVLDSDLRRDLFERRREIVDLIQNQDDLDNEAKKKYEKASQEISSEFKKALDTHVEEMLTKRDEAILAWQNWWLENKQGDRIDWLISGLQHPSTLSRKNSLISLGDLGASEALDEIINLLQDDQTEVVTTACQTLAKLKLKAAIPALIDLLKTTENSHSDEQMLIRNYSAYQALLTLTQANFSSLSTAWESWWQRSQDFFTIGQDLPHGDYNIRLLAVSDQTATLEVKYYYNAQNEWFSNEFEVSIGEEVGEPQLEHTFLINGRTYTRAFDMRPQIILSDIQNSRVFFKPKSSEITTFELQQP